MSSYCESGHVRLLPEENSDEREDFGGYPFSLPKVFLEGAFESYHPQVDFSWHDDSVVVVRDGRIVKYTQSHFSELLAEDEQGNVIWVDGRNAPYANCWDGKYLGKVRGAQAYTIVEYDLKASEKKTYKVTLEETARFDQWDTYHLAQFADPQELGQKFEIRDGELTHYYGTDAELVIPDTVTSLGWGVFDHRNTFKSITIPKSLVEINVEILRRCKTERIEVAEDNPRYEYKNGLLMDRLTGTLVLALTGTVIPGDGSVTRIGPYAFCGRSDLQSIAIPDTVTEIGYHAFTDCVNLTRVLLPDSVTQIDSNAFCDCEKLVQVVLPASITAISSDLFARCRSLKSITIPDSVRSIDARAFINCAALETVVIPPTVLKLGNSAFYGCEALREVLLPPSITCIEIDTFRNCSKLQRIVIPPSVLQIGDGAFSGCASLEALELPDSVLEIGSWAFNECESLQSVEIPDSVIYLGKGVFQQCRALERAVLPASVMQIPASLFCGCEKLADVKLPETVVCIEESAFVRCDCLTGVELPATLKKIGMYAFRHSGLRSLTVPDSVKQIEDLAFDQCGNLMEVNVPQKLMAQNRQIFGRDSTEKKKSFNEFVF